MKMLADRQRKSRRLVSADMKFEQKKKKKNRKKDRRKKNDILKKDLQKNYYE